LSKSEGIKEKTRLIYSNGFLNIFYTIQYIIFSPESQYENDDDVIE